MFIYSYTLKPVVNSSDFLLLILYSTIAAGLMFAVSISMASKNLNQNLKKALKNENPLVFHVVTQTHLHLLANNRKYMISV